MPAVGQIALATSRRLSQIVPSSGDCILLASIRARNSSGRGAPARISFSNCCLAQLARRPMRSRSPLPVGSSASVTPGSRPSLWLLHFIMLLLPLASRTIRGLLGWPSTFRACLSNHERTASAGTELSSSHRSRFKHQPYEGERSATGFEMQASFIFQRPPSPSFPDDRRSRMRSSPNAGSRSCGWSLAAVRR